MATLPKAKELLRVRIGNQLYEIAQYFRDIEHWNRIHPEEPIEADPKGEMAALRAKLTKMAKKVLP